MRYRADIDGLRALAILLVTVFHFDLFSIGKAGFIGVDIFFVISGFLITRIIVHELEDGTFHFGTFLYRRVRRLYPALLTTLALYLIAGAFLLLPDTYKELSIEAFLSQLYIVNFYFWRTVNYFGLQADNVPLLHMWSLAVEEQFYLLFPIACLLVWRWRPQAFPAAILIATILSFLLGYVATVWKPWASFYLLPTRAWELLAGSLLALGVGNWNMQVKALGALGPVGLALIGLALFVHTPATGVPGAFALLPVAGAVCLILSGLNTQAATTKILSTRPLVWIGLISYPLYLVHWPLMIMIKESVFDFTLPWRLIGFSASFLLAWLIYRFVEKPIRTGQFFRTPHRYLQATVAISMLLMTSSLGIWVSGGLPQRFDPKVAETLAYTEDTADRFRHCQDQFRNTSTPPCILGDTNAEPDMLIYGDSHAGAFSLAISQWLERQGRAAFFSFSYGCLPVLNMGAAKCMDQTDGAIRFAQNASEVDTVMLISIWRQPYGGGMLHRGNWVGSVQSVQAFAEELEKTVSAFQAVGKQIVLVDPFFAARANVPKTLAKNLAFGRNWSVDKPVSQHQQEFEQLFEAFDRAVLVGAHRISLINDFCTTSICRASLQGRPVFSDGNHVAAGMSDVLSRVIEREMIALGN